MAKLAGTFEAACVSKGGPETGHFGAISDRGQVHGVHLCLASHTRPNLHGCQHRKPFFRFLGCEAKILEKSGGWKWKMLHHVIL